MSMRRPIRGILAIVAACALLAACERRPPPPLTADQRACADPAAVSRVNFRHVVESAEGRPFPDADVIVGSETGPLTVRRTIAISGRHITDAKVNFDGDGRPVVNIRLDDEGAQQMLRASGPTHMGQRLALVMDGQVIVAPTLQGPLKGGAMQLHTQATMKDSEALALMIRGASLGCVVPIPAP